MASLAPVFVAYYRVSTRKQGRSGLGLEAQRSTVSGFALASGGRIVAEFTEQESGKLALRPQLQRALTACRLHRAVLVVAKLDRLARNAAFLLSLRDASVEIVACDLPSMNRMTVGIMAVVAEEEARLISERTRLALAAAKRRGARLGTPSNLTDFARRKGSASSSIARRGVADRRALDLRPLLDELRPSGRGSLRLLAQALNERGIGAPRGGVWTPTAIARVLRRTNES